MVLARSFLALRVLGRSRSTTGNTNTNNTHKRSMATTPPSTSGTVRSMAILVGTSASAATSGSSGSSSYNHILPVVVWVCHERPRESQSDPWRHTLEYFEFLDDTSRWTHLDHLLLRCQPQAVHVASIESAKSDSKKRMLDRVMESLQLFLEERVVASTPNIDTLGDSDDSSNQAPLSTALHWHQHSSLETQKVQSALSNLLLQDSDVQLAYRKNVQLSRPGLLQQGLALWLLAEGLLLPSSRTIIGASATPDASWQNSAKLQVGVLNSYLTMDRTAAMCIHLLPPPNTGVASVVGGNAHNNSLWGVLSKPCATNMGKLKLQLWLRQPLISLPAIMYRQNAVTNLLQGVGKDSLREALLAFGNADLSQLAASLSEYMDSSEEGTARSTIVNTKKPLKALYQLYLLSSTQLPQLAESLESFEIYQDEGAPSLLQDSKAQLHKLLAELDRCQGLAEAVLDLDQAPREYLVKPTFSPDLQDLHRELVSIREQVDEELNNIQELWDETMGGGNQGQIRLEQVSEGTKSSWQFRLPDTNHEKALKQMPAQAGIQTHRVLKNGVYFSSRLLRQLSSSHTDASSQYSQHSAQVVLDAMNVACTYTTVVERAAELVSTLDCVSAMAHVAAYNPHGYCKPTLTDSDDAGAGIELEAARHPCVELQDDMEFIPNDVTLTFGEEDSTSNASNFLLVTGPNMGGKSTYIRSLGAIVCLAQIGSYVPATSATINICHSLLARVGAGDLQDRGISTFMAEMLEASSILRTATRRSLIVIDELGRGTSTFDGYGLARAISEYLQQRIGCLTVFATHFHELTQLPGIQNCHVTARKGNQGLTFLYEVRPGPCLESFGIQVAEMANVPPVVIEDAKRKAAELEHFGTSERKRAKKSDLEFINKFRSLDLPALLKAGGTKESLQSQLKQILGTA
eukprot:Nitzschia sp. Nitz4//scaffold74_size92883//24683//27581//NITZ4_004818-RA/size92883-augustus-gene-0.4-mRNA-1//1//CDS//3329557580//6079//frame0